MSWLQIELVVTPEKLEALEAVMFAAGCVSVALVSESDEPVLEPAPGEMPLWRSIRLQCLFPLSVDFGALRRLLTEEDAVSVEPTFVGETDWQSYARSFATDEVFAERLHLRPPLSADESYEPGALVPLFLEPGLAFGSGSHPTTRLCLDWIAKNVVTDTKVLDFGCGSGVLAIAAALLGAEVVAVDHDDQAVTATKENARINKVASRVRVLNLKAWLANRENEFDVVVANILAGPLRDLADEFVQAAKPRSVMVLAGLLADQVNDVKSAYAGTVDFVSAEQIEDWVRLVGVSGDL
ncbi:MAG: 50S ribosomal protein L11 methyltransferase [Pseudomonadales bacterium]|nr:50S ribosomal protein L11 methyltransferase [Pseudomonadales bacterium]